MASSIDNKIIKENQFYNLTREKLYEKLDTTENGLSNEEAENRLKTFGDNKLPKEKKRQSSEKVSQAIQ